MLFVLFSRLVLDGIAGLKFLFELKPIHTWAILKAHFSFYKNLNNFIKKRKKLSRKQDYNQHTNIVWQYFALGRKEFKDLQ